MDVTACGKDWFMFMLRT